MTPGPKTARILRRKPGLLPLSAPPSGRASGSAAGGLSGRVSVGFVSGILLTIPALREWRQQGTVLRTPRQQDCNRTEVACPRKTRLASSLGVHRQFRRRPTADGRSTAKSARWEPQRRLSGGGASSRCGPGGIRIAMRRIGAEVLYGVRCGARGTGKEERSATDGVSVTLLRGEGGCI